MTPILKIDCVTWNFSIDLQIMLLWIAKNSKIYQTSETKERRSENMVVNLLSLSKQTKEEKKSTPIVFLISSSMHVIKQVRN